MTTFAQLEDQKARMLDQIATWSPTRLAYCPSPGEWSVLEMLDHLAKTEASILEITRKGLNKPHRVGMTDRVRNRFLDSVFRSDRKVKVPASASRVLPSTNPDLPGILSRWSQTRADLADFLAQVAPAQLKPGVFHHPVGGWMNIPEVLNFFSIHLIHHTFQLNRLAAESLRAAAEIPTQ